MTEIEKWNSIEAKRWTCIPSLGANWLGKWVSSAKGFTIMITDGVQLWGEIQDVAYITEKAKDWAICIEGDIESLSKEILSQLQQQTSILTRNQEGSSVCIIELSACLEGLPYKWMFHLDPLPSDVVLHHWTYPLVSTLKSMDTRVQALETALRRRERQLKELDPKYQSICDLSCNTVDASAFATDIVRSVGLGKALCDNRYFNNGAPNTLPNGVASCQEASVDRSTEKDLLPKASSIMPCERVSQRSLSTKHDLASDNPSHTKKKPKKKIKI